MLNNVYVFIYSFQNSIFRYYFVPLWMNSAVLYTYIIRCRAQVTQRTNVDKE